MEWISVDDQLPEFTKGDSWNKCSDPILVTDGKDIYIGCFVMYRCTKIGEFVCKKVSDGITGDRMPIMLDTLTHWMPIPKPPEVKL